VFSTVSSLISHIKTKIHDKLSSIKASTAAQPKLMEQSLPYNVSKMPTRQITRAYDEGEIEPVKFSKLVKIKVDTCPHCKYFTNDKTMHKHITIEGPLFLRKELAREGLRPLIRISEVLKCSRCGYEKVKKKIYIPIETIDLLEPLLCGDVVEVIGKVKNISSNVEKVLTKFLG